MSLQVEITTELETCLSLREEVFINEHAVPADLERDEYDAVAIHLLALDFDKAIGTARVLRQDGFLKIGRVCVLKSYRGQGVGAALTQFAIAYARADNSLRGAKLSAQVPVLGFYENFGFQPVGAQYLDAGIQHQDMVLTF